MGLTCGFFSRIISGVFTRGIIGRFLNDLLGIRLSALSLGRFFSGLVCCLIRAFFTRFIGSCFFYRLLGRFVACFILSGILSSLLFLNSLVVCLGFRFFNYLFFDGFLLCFGFCFCFSLIFGRLLITGFFRYLLFYGLL